MDERPHRINQARRLLVRFTRSNWRRFVISSLVGLLILFAMRMPGADRTMLGEPDRQMMQTAFKMRADLGGGEADPGLLIDVDDDTIADSLPQPPKGLMPGAPPATTPRSVVADVLEYIRTARPGEAPKAVILDLDVATPTPGDEAGVAKLRSVLGAWAQTPTAPPLIIARQSYPDLIYGGQSGRLLLPATVVDDIVYPAPNIFWSQVKVMADQNGVMREILPYECIIGATGEKPLFSASLLAYYFMQNRNIPKDSPANGWLDEGAAKCKPGVTADPPVHGELINFHISLGKGENNRVWPEMPDTWPGFKRCGPGGDRAMFRRLSAKDVAAAGAAGPDASHALLCDRLVLIGGTNMVAADFQQTPLNEMSGTVILANAATGLQMSHGGLRRVPWPIQIGSLLFVSMLITGGYLLTRKIREHYLSLRTRHREAPLWVKVLITPFNPLVLNWAFAFVAHWIGIGLLIYAMGLGYWGYLSAPAFAAAATGAMQEFADDDD